MHHESSGVGANAGARLSKQPAQVDARVDNPGAAIHVEARGSVVIFQELETSMGMTVAAAIAQLCLHPRKAMFAETAATDVLEGVDMGLSFQGHSLDI